MMKKINLFSKFFTITFFILAISNVSIAQEEENDLPEELGTALGVHKIHLATEEIPKYFKDIEYIYFDKLSNMDDLNPPTDKNGIVKIIGELKMQNGLIFNYKTAYFKRLSNGKYKGIIFETIELNGVKYKFCGNFLEEKIYDEKRGGFTRIKGELVKYKNGQKVASNSFPFYEYAEL